MTPLAPPALTTTIDSPVGLLTLTGFPGVLTGLQMEGQAHTPPLPDGCTRDDRAFAPVKAQLEAYFAGELTEFDVNLRLEGTEFQQRVWGSLRRIPYGETWSYARLAALVGNPAASRAVGVANSRNPIAIIVPCHRVIGANGTLTGYAGGLDRKAWLLGLERRAARPGLLDG